MDPLESSLPDFVRSPYLDVDAESASVVAMLSKDEARAEHGEEEGESRGVSESIVWGEDASKRTVDGRWGRKGARGREKEIRAREIGMRWLGAGGEYILHGDGNLVFHGVEVQGEGRCTAARP